MYNSTLVQKYSSHGQCCIIALHVPPLSGQCRIYAPLVAAVCLLLLLQLVWLLASLLCFHWLLALLFALVVFVATGRSCASLPSDPNFLLELINNIPEELGSSDKEFDGYLGPDNCPVTFASGHSLEDYDSGTALACSRSFDSLTELEREQTESLYLCTNPSPFPTDSQHASSFPLVSSPSHSTSHAQDTCQV